MSIFVDDSIYLRTDDNVYPRIDDNVYLRVDDNVYYGHLGGPKIDDIFGGPKIDDDCAHWQQQHATIMIRLPRRARPSDSHGLRAGPHDGRADWP